MLRRKIQDRKIILEYQHQPDEWPWQYVTQQAFILLENGLEIQLSITNESDTEMPVDLGFHPYFSSSEHSILQFKHSGYWHNSDLGFPTHKVKGALLDDYNLGGKVVANNMVNHTHFDWSGEAWLEEPGRPSIKISGSNELKNLHVFFLPEGGFVAIEPQHGKADPFAVYSNAEPAVKSLAPGETWEVWMRIEGFERERISSTNKELRGG